MKVNLFYFNDYRKFHHDKFKNSTKEERAEVLGNIICPKCGYQNKKYYVKKYGTCNLCKTTLDKEHFKKVLLKKLK